MKRLLSKDKKRKSQPEMVESSEFPSSCGFIGGGAMAEALLSGFVSKSVFENESITVSDVSDSRLSLMQDKYGCQVTTSNPKLLEHMEIIVLSVKPQILDKVLEEIAPHVTPNHLVVSVAAGVPIEKIEHKLGQGTRVVRVMPNTPSKIGAGASGFSLG